ncbi:MAG: PEP-CTERM sorting domain-containing protein [Armatimonadetes bacterium]|nr:PEP-CTERM sorting domain-containing protein [Armatimonadota bacterium]
MKLRHLNSIATLALCAAFAGPAMADGIFPDTHAVTFSFSDAADLEQTRMTLAWDGTNYWSSSGGGNTGLRLAQYAADGTLLNTYEPGLDLRSVFTNGGAGPVYARQYNDSQIYVQTSPGVFGTDVVLSGGSLDAQGSVAFDDSGAFIAMNAGNVDRWDAAGNYIESIALSGFGSMFNENTYPQNRGLAFFGGMDFPHFLTYSEGMLSAWDAAGIRVGTTELLTGGITFDSHFSLSYANGMVWVVDEPGGLWKGYELQVVPEPATFVALAAGVCMLLRRRR